MRSFHSQEHDAPAIKMLGEALIPFLETAIPGHASRGGDDAWKIIGAQFAKFIHGSPFCRSVQRNETPGKTDLTVKGHAEAI